MKIATIKALRPFSSPRTGNMLQGETRAGISLAFADHLAENGLVEIVETGEQKRPPGAGPAAPEKGAGKTGKDAAENAATASDKPPAKKRGRKPKAVTGETDSGDGAG